MKIKYRDLNIGADAAEQESIEQLKSYFLITKEFSDIAGHKHHFVIGNRGTGKSAILRIIQNSPSAGSTIYITPERYSYSVLKSILEEKPQVKWGQESSFASAWKYSILILILKEVEKSSKGTLVRGAKKNIHNYLRDNHENVHFDGITLLYKFLERMQQIKAGDLSVALNKAASLQRLYKLEELDKVKPDLTDILDREPFTILIDELDTGWDGSEHAQHFIAGLFAAAQDLNAFHKNLNLVVSLRQDIFEGVPSIYSDQEKIRDQIVRLKWNDASLFEMISNRLEAGLKQHLSECNKENAWGKIFSEDLAYRGTKSQTYIVDRTLYRPREMIQFLKAIFKSTEKTIDQELVYEDILEGEKEFSEAKIKDLSAEYQNLHPGLLHLMESFRGSAYELTKKELEEKLLTFALSDTAKNCGPWAYEVDHPEQLVKILYDVGFIKAYLAGAQTGGRKHGSAYYGSYELPFKPNLNDVERFRISLVFRQYLRLKEKK